TLEGDDALQVDPLEIEHNLGHVLPDVGDRRKFVPHVVNPDSGNRDALERAKQDAPKRIAECGAVAGIKRTDVVSTIVEPGLDAFNGELGLLQQADSPPHATLPWHLARQ